MKSVWGDKWRLVPACSSMCQKSLLLGSRQWSSWTAIIMAPGTLQPEAKQKRKKWCNSVYFIAYVFAAIIPMQDKEQALMCLLQFWGMRNNVKVSLFLCCLASNATAAKEFCEEHECPASWKDANGENCCVYHANIHSCPLAFMVSIMCSVLATGWDIIVITNFKFVKSFCDYS